MWHINFHKQCPICEKEDIRKTGEHFRGTTFVEEFRCNCCSHSWMVDENGSRVY
jgi:transposase-like protein